MKKHSSTNQKMKIEEIKKELNNLIIQKQNLKISVKDVFEIMIYPIIVLVVVVIAGILFHLSNNYMHLLGFVGALIGCSFSFVSFTNKWKERKKSQKDLEFRIGFLENELTKENEILKQLLEKERLQINDLNVKKEEIAILLLNLQEQLMIIEKNCDWFLKLADQYNKGLRLEEKEKNVQDGMDESCLVEGNSRKLVKEKGD